MSAPAVRTSGGRFDFDDGGTYCGGWEDGKAHGHGVCTGPKGQGEYCGSWHYGFEVSGVYTWPSGSGYEGQWQNGKRHGLGVENRGRWVYRGEWTQGLKGRYGVRQSTTSGAKYEGTWANGLQDGYGSETYADGGSYQGQWLRGTRHGYGVRSSAPFGLAAHNKPSKNLRASVTSLRSEHPVDPASERDRKIDDCRGGFVLKARSDEVPQRRRSLVEKSSNLKRSILQGLRIKKQHSTGDIDKRGTSASLRSSGSNMSSASSESSQSGLTHGSAHTDSNVSFVSQEDITDQNVIETYMGEWKNDKRSGYGIAERSDGLKYEGEWYNNKKYGYGVTTFKDGSREEGKYKNNVLVTSGKKKHLFLLRSAKFRDRIEAAVNAAIRASQIALQKADIAISRTATARGKSEQADVAAVHARDDAEVARSVSKQFAPELYTPADLLKKLAEVPDIGKLRIPGLTSGGATPQRKRSLFAPAGATRPPDFPSPAQLEQLKQLSQPEPNPAAAEPEQPGEMPRQGAGAPEPPPRTPHGSVRRSLRDGYTLQQAMNDHFDQYRRTPSRPPSRPPSRSRISQSPAPAVRQPEMAPLSSVYTDCTPDSGVSESMDGDDTSPTRTNRRSTLPNLYAANLVSFASDVEPPNEVRNDEVTPQRTASLYVGVGRRKVPQPPEPPKRKKSLPDIAALEGKAPKVMSREEVAALSSHRREELRRLQEEAERLRANPLLYLFNPDVKDWFSRQQLVMLVLFINISLAIMFFKLLT